MFQAASFDRALFRLLHELAGLWAQFVLAGLDQALKSVHVAAQYIWRSHGDNKVRASHTANGGKVFLLHDVFYKHDGVFYGMKRNWFYISLGLLVLTISGLLFYAGKPEIIATLWISAIALALSYNAYVFTKEKFRLDLLERRFEIYQDLLKFCSLFATHATLRSNDSNKEDVSEAHKAAHRSFRGIGHHKSKILFGGDIHALMDKLNVSYSFLNAQAERPDDPNEHQTWLQKTYEHTGFIVELIGKLPDIFKPYVYFGDYKGDA